MRAFAIGSALALASACTPIVPFHFAETAETLAKKNVTFTIAGGGGVDPKLSGSATGGVDARVRVGVGARMEVGIELAAVGGARSEVTCGIKASYKYAPTSYLALLAGIGVTDSIGFHAAGQPGVGADVGLVASTPLLAKHVRVYGGARFSFVVPAVATRFYEAGGPTQALTIPVGVAIALPHRWQLFFEVGYLGVWSENQSRPLPIATNHFDAGFGALAFAHTWGK